MERSNRSDELLSRRVCLSFTHSFLIILLRQLFGKLSNHSKDINKIYAGTLGTFNVVDQQADRPTPKNKI